MPKTPSTWPAGCLPRLLSEDMAAFYCGISAGTFAKEVAAGRYPAPRKVGARKLYDRKALDKVLDGDAEPLPAVAEQDVLARIEQWRQS